MTIHFELCSDTICKVIELTPTHAKINGSSLDLSDELYNRMVNGVHCMHDMVQNGELNELGNVESTLRELK